MRLKWWLPLGVVIADQVVKWIWSGEVVRNPGTLRGWVGLVIIGMMVWFRPRPLGWWLIVGGGMGNVIDWLIRGYVVDMFKLPITFWFNLADVAIIAGSLWLIVSSRK